MPVYVDNAFIPADVPNGNRIVSGQWCHLTADTTEELHEFARRLGLKRSWFQPAKTIPDNEYTRTKCPERIGKVRPGSRDHYDVTQRVREKAVRLGAIPVNIGCEGWRDRKKERAEEDALFPEPTEGREPVTVEATEPGGYEPVNDGSHYGQ